MKKLLSTIIVLTILASTILITPIVASANNVIPNDNKWHQFNVNADSTYTYDIVLPSTGRIYVDLFFATYDSYSNEYSLYDNDYKNELTWGHVDVDESIPSTEGFDKVLSKGTYHLVFKTDERGGYIKVKPKFLTYNCNTKNNTSYDSPNILTNNKIYTGAFTETNNEYAWYKFTIPSRRIVKLSFWTYSGLDYYLYNKDLQNTIRECDRFYSDFYGTETTPLGRTETVTLNKGTYYVKLSGSKGKYKVRVTSFTTPKLNCKSATIKRNKTRQLKVTGGSGTIKWSTSNKRIATVNSKGKVTGKKKGSCYIYARRNGYKMTCKVRVK